MTSLAPFIEHTLLRPDATSEDIRNLCQEAITHHFFGVCVYGSHVELAASVLEDSGPRIIAVAGFPHGAQDSDVKRFETEAAGDNGAHEIDVVMNIGRLKEGDTRYVLRELFDVVAAAEERPVKVILETCLLSREEKIIACQLAVEAGAKFVKTSTGFSKGGATVQDVQLMRETVGAKFGVKASGGIRDIVYARSLIEAGANRLGTSSGIGLVADGSDVPSSY